MGSSQEIFETYGADYKTTMTRFLGNEALYLKFLDMLFKDDNYDKLGAALKAENYEEAFNAAHTLKGVVGNMGLTPFFNAVCDIVEPLRQGKRETDYMALYKILQTEYEKAYKFRDRLNEGR